MDFVALILFLALYYLRPQEWFADFNALRPVQLLSFLAVWAMFQTHKLNPRDLVRTPLDWLIACYFVWTLFAGGQFLHTLTGIEAVLLFYFVAVRSLDSVPRQKTFLAWWCGFMLIIALLAIVSQYGFDPLGSYDKTEGPMKGRLILNLTVFNNPNSLAHSIVPAVPLVYYLVFWRRTFMRAGLLLMAIPLYCIFLTVSKGAFLCGFATILATLTFGRSKAAQVVIVVLAVGLGYGALFKLPRMQELNHAKSDSAIQGRVAALSYGMELMRTNFFGIGLGNFQDIFFRYGPREKVPLVQVIGAHAVPGNEGTVHQIGAKRKVKYIYRHFVKATHCAYNQNGAELGYVGLYLFVGILYCCIRTLVLMKCADDDEERIRRALFAMVVAYAVSSWMVDFCYRPTFFLMVAAISAFHRHLLRKQAEADAPVEEKPVVPNRPWLRRLPPIRIPGISLAGLGSPLALGSAQSVATEAPAPSLLSPAGAPGGRVLPYDATAARPQAWDKPDSSLQAAILRKFIWTRLGPMDFVIILLLTWATICYWQHLIVKM